MSKYKVGDKFIIEIAEVYENVLSGIDAFEDATSEPLYRIKGFNSLVFDKNGLDKLEEIEQIVNECDGYDGNSTFLALQLIKDLDRLRKCISIDVQID